MPRSVSLKLSGGLEGWGRVRKPPRLVSRLGIGQEMTWRCANSPKICSGRNTWRTDGISTTTTTDNHHHHHNNNNNSYSYYPKQKKKTL